MTRKTDTATANAYAEAHLERARGDRLAAMVDRRDNKIMDYDIEQNALQAAIDHLEKEVSDLKEALAEEWTDHEAAITKLRAEVAEPTIAWRAAIERERAIGAKACAHRDAKIAERDGKIAKLQADVAERDASIDAPDA